MKGTAAQIASNLKKDDSASYAARTKLLRRMATLRAINESLATWMTECSSEWDALNRTDDERHASLLHWNQERGGKVGAADVPTMKNLLESGSGLDRRPPAWFEVSKVSAKALELAWDSAVRGECALDGSKTGGAAVSALYSMLVDAKACASKERAFEWNSHGYSPDRSREDVEAALDRIEEEEGKELDVALPAEHRKAIDAYVAALSSAPASESDAMSARLSKMVVSASPSSAASSSAGWWANSSWTSTASM